MCPFAPTLGPNADCCVAQVDEPAAGDYASLRRMAAGSEIRPNVLIRVRLRARRGTVRCVSGGEQVIEAARARAAALANGDAERLLELLHEDFRWTTHVGSTYDRTEYIRRNTEGDTVWRSQDLFKPEVVVVDQTAVLYAEVEDVVVSEDDESATFRMPMTQVWVRSGSGWKCLAGHAGPRLT